jgi:hypothetical protein
MRYKEGTTPFSTHLQPSKKRVYVPYHIIARSSRLLCRAVGRTEEAMTIIARITTSSAKAVTPGYHLSPHVVWFPGSSPARQVRMNLFPSCTDPLNMLTLCLFPITLDSKTGRQQWISVDRGGNSIGLWSGWKPLVCDYSHIFAVGWMHNIAVNCFSQAQKLEAKGRAFW